MLPFRPHRCIATVHIWAEVLEIRNEERAVTDAKPTLPEEMAI